MFFSFFTVLFILHGLAWTNAQSGGNGSILLKSNVFREQLQLFTDRDIYAVSEKIFFRAFNISNPDLIKINWSKILYVEIISTKNAPVAQAKYLWGENGTSGYIKIPETAPGGIYYLRAYTRWMRNFSPADYFHSPITIINPEKNVLQVGQDLPVQYAGSLKNHFKIQRNAILCKTDKKIYQKREKATINLVKPGEKMDSPGGYCLSVIKKGTLDTDNYRMSFPLDTLEHDTLYYFPETKGFSFSGKVISENGESHSSNTRVHLSFPGNKTDFFSLHTDSEGKFRFSLPQGTGIQDGIITVETDNDIPSRIIIDKDFSSDFVPLPEYPYVPSSELIEHIRKVMVKMQIAKIFSEPPSNNEPAIGKNSSEYWFYGHPHITLKTEDYVKLPTLEEFFFELIPTVVLTKKKEGKYFTVTGNHTGSALNKPLILLDHVPVTDVETILPLSPERIDHIDIINDTYIRGSESFGGIINIVSHEGDRAGVDLPRNSVFVSFKTPEPQQEIKFPDYSTKSHSDRIPDFRNCLFWVPDIELAAGEQTRFDFYTSDEQGEYIVVVRGITSDGIILEGQSQFIVQ